MARWLQAQINEGVVEGRRRLPAGLIASTHDPIARQNDRFGPYERDGYGLGWQTGRYGSESLVHHFGNFAGSRAHVSFMPGRRLGVAVMVNEDAVCGDAADLIANYLYERRLGRADVDARFTAELARLRETRDTRRKRIAENRAQIAARPRTLSRSNADYAGRYDNLALGAFTVAVTGDGLAVNMGRLSATAQAFTRPEAIRVELIPGQGQSVQFRLDAAGVVTGATMSGYDFTRVV